MRPDKMKDFLDTFDMMEFRIDKEKRETSYTVVKMRHRKELKAMLKDLYGEDTPPTPRSPHPYDLAKSGWTYKGRYGRLLLHFIKTDFSTLEGFTEFIKRWGFAGLLDINPDFDSPVLAERFYSAQEVEIIYRKFYEGTHEALRQAQQDFRYVVDYCLDVSEKPALEPLNSHARYIVGTLRDEIPSLEVYSKKTRVLHVLDWNTEMDLLTSSVTLEDLAGKVARVKPGFVTAYQGLDIRTFVYHEFFAIIDDLLLRKCQNCGSYFVAKHKISELYCEKCRNVAYMTRVKGDPFLAAYTTAYRSRHREKQRRLKLSSEKDTKSAEKWQGLMDTWVKYAKENMQSAQKGEITIEEFKERLKTRLEDMKDGH